MPRIAPLWPIGLAALLAGAGAALAEGFAPGRPLPVASSVEASYLAENDAAMARMMRGMTIKPSGDVDRDFVHMMVPHHQGAIDMAIAVLRYGHNPQIRRLAQEIIVDQQQEIQAGWIGSADAAGGLHHQPGRRGRGQRGGADPAGGAVRRRCGAPIPGDRARGRGRRARAGAARALTGRRRVDLPRLRPHPKVG